MGSSMYDYVVIGSGVAGYPAACRLADRGFRVAVVERGAIGGECTNYGCVPSKALYRVAQAAETARRLGGELRAGWERVADWVRGIVGEARRGIEVLLEERDVDIYRGGAVVHGSRVAVGDKVLEARRVLVAVGTEPKPFPGTVFDEKRIMSNRGFYKPLEEPPRRLLIVGAGVIGVEAAYAAATAMGAEVTVVEALPRIMPGYDIDVARTIERYLKREHGVLVYKKTYVDKLRPLSGGVEAVIGGERKVFDAALIAIGRRPLGPEAAPELGFGPGGFIEHDDSMATSDPRIYVAGDAAGPPLLAHKAIIEGLVAAENMAGGSMRAPPRHLIPSTVFTGLEAAAVGFTEEELREKGVAYKKYKLSVGYLSSIRIKDGAYSFVKILVDRSRPEKVYGIHIVAPNASEAISGYLPFIYTGIDPRRTAYTPYPHLTVGETIREIAEYMLGEPVHRILKR